MNQVRIVAHKQYSVTSHDCLEGVRPAGSGFRVGFREENEEASRSAPFASRKVVEVEEEMTEMTWPHPKCAFRSLHETPPPQKSLS